MPAKKKNSKIQLCVYFWDINKACPRDEFSLPIIDKFNAVLTDRHSIFSFVDVSINPSNIQLELIL